LGCDLWKDTRLPDIVFLFLGPFFGPNLSTCPRYRWRSPKIFRRRWWNRCMYSQESPPKSRQSYWCTTKFNSNPGGSEQVKQVLHRKLEAWKCKKFSKFIRYFLAASPEIILFLPPCSNLFLSSMISPKLPLYLFHFAKTSWLKSVLEPKVSQLKRQFQQKN